jgi:alpha-ribazole phosphatase/probable phosphoglycerate mutase
MSDTVIDLIRHGKPLGGRRYRGQIDDPLSERGWAQMWSAVEVAAPWERIISSPLVRCSAFAQALAEKMGIPFRKDGRLKEVGFGDWEGHSGSELKRDDPQILARFYRDPVRHRPEGAETLEAFQSRVREVFEEIRAEQQGRHVLVVTHAGVIRGGIAHVVQAPLSGMYRISVPTASLARVLSNTERPPTLMFHGRRSL